MQLVAHAIKDRKIMAVVATCCSTEPGAPRVLQRYDNEEHKDIESGTVPRSKIIAKYASLAGVIDLHNRYRQGILELERVLVTTKWWRRIYHSVLGVLVTNAYLLYVAEHDEREFSTLKEFVHALCRELIYNDAGGKSKRRAHEMSSGAGGGADRAPCFAQALGDLPRYAEAIRAQLRCTICGRKASYCCRACSKPEIVVTVCGTGTGRACWSKHCWK